MLTLPEHLSSSPVFSGVLVTRSLVLYVCFVDRCCPFVHFLFAIVLSVLLLLAIVLSVLLLLAIVLSVLLLLAIVLSVLLLLAIVLSVLLRFTDSDYPFGIFRLILYFCFWPLCCLFIFDLPDYPFGIFRLILYFFFWPLCCLFFFDLRILITPLVSSDLFCTFSFGHCVVCSSSIYGF